MEKKEYITPETEILEFDVIDVMVTSGKDDNELDGPY